MTNRNPLDEAHERHRRALADRITGRTIVAVDGETDAVDWTRLRITLDDGSRIDIDTEPYRWSDAARISADVTEPPQP